MDVAVAGVRDLSHDLALQRDLARLNHGRFTAALPADDWRASLANEVAMRTREIEFLESRRGAIANAATGAPRKAAGFVRWFAELAQSGPGQGSGLFPWLARTATLEQLRWFLHQELGAAGQLGVELAELVALVQITLPERTRAPLVRVYCDAAGIGDAYAAGGPRFASISQLASELGLVSSSSSVTAEALAVGNVVAGLAANRRYAYHAIGALAAGALTAAAHAELVDAGLARCHVTVDVREAYAERALVSARHAETWTRDVISSLVAQHPELATAIAEGGLMRVSAGATCFARYRRELMPEARATGVRAA